MLQTWAGSPARFREDANAEEDLALGGYRDRLLVELAQNAADAAARAGVPGRLRLSLRDGVLTAANTGAPLDAAGVDGLATLRASAKRDAATVGRFGVGFAAVLAVTDAPAVRSTEGGVRFSAAATREALAAVPALVAEVTRRDGRVPVLRLPWPDPLPPAAGFDTEVVLPLRPEAVDVVRTALHDLDVTLLLALPGLAEVDVDGRVLRRHDDGADTLLVDGTVTMRWRVQQAAGVLAPELLADRPVEERDRPNWTILWAVPVDEEGRVAPLPVPQVVHAPTPSDEPLSLPVRLVASFPLDPARRHVAPGPLTDHLVERAAAAYAGLVARLAPEPGLLALVPRPAFATAALEAALAAAVLAALREEPLLPAAADPARADPAGADPAGADPAVRLPGDRAAVLDAGAVTAAAEDLLADVVPGLLPASWWGRAADPALAALGVRRVRTADLVEAVAAVDREPQWWHRLYAALESAADRDALAGLPVPLADGRVVSGTRGLVLPTSGLPADAAAALGLRVVHPEAAHPLLLRLGALEATPQTVLADPAVREVVEESYDSDDPEPLADAVLALVAVAGVGAGDLPWLADLALRGADGEHYPAGELLLPDGPLRAVVAADAPFGVVAGDLVDRWGEDVLVATGVLNSFAVLRETDVPLDGAVHHLDGEREWQDTVLDRLPQHAVPPVLEEFRAVRDLELVRADAWAEALPLVPRDTLRPAVATLGGERVEVLSYTRWWLSHHPVLDGRTPRELRTATASDLAGLYDVTGHELAADLGAWPSLDSVLGDVDAAVDLLDRLGDDSRTVEPAVLRDVYARLAMTLSNVDTEPPHRVRVAPDRTAAATDAVVLDAPWLLPLLGHRQVVPAGGAAVAVADLLDLVLASEAVPGVTVSSTPRSVRPWSDVPGAALAAERLGRPLPDGTVATHAPLLAGRVPVPWWPAAAAPAGTDSPDHVDEAAGAASFGRALAWRVGRWDARAAAAEALAAPEAVDRLRAEDATG